MSSRQETHQEVREIVLDYGGRGLLESAASKASAVVMLVGVGYTTALIVGKAWEVAGSWLNERIRVAGVEDRLRMDIRMANHESRLRTLEGRPLFDVDPASPKPGAARLPGGTAVTDEEKRKILEALNANNRGVCTCEDPSCRNREPEPPTSGAATA